MPNNPPQARKLALILAFSLLAHALLLLLPAAQKPSSSQPRPSGVTLVALPAPPTPPAPEPDPEATAQPETATVVEETPATEPSSSPDATPPEPVEPTSTDADEIRRQALQLAGEATVEEDEGTRNSTLAFRSAPRLPGTTGWMDAHIGTVRVSREHWQAADGGLHSRVVAASGQVVCASIRPPTVQEFFNPTMSAAVTMLRDCGRERPGPRQAGDPWERAASD